MNDWWEKATGEEYIRRAKCIVDQYSDRYNEQTGLYLKGKQNQGENIADNGGIKESYMAYSEFSFDTQVQLQTESHGSWNPWRGRDFPITNTQELTETRG